MSPEQAKAARELLAFYLEAGADALLGEEPINRLAEPEPEARPARPMVRDLRPAPHHEAPPERQRPPLRPEEPAVAGRLEGPPMAPAAPEAAIMDARAQ